MRYRYRLLVDPPVRSTSGSPCVGPMDLVGRSAFGGALWGSLTRTWGAEADADLLAAVADSNDERDAPGVVDPVTARVGEPPCSPGVGAARDHEPLAGRRRGSAPPNPHAVVVLLRYDKLERRARLDGQPSLCKQSGGTCLVAGQ